jgi:hypothetical protein
MTSQLGLGTVLVALTVLVHTVGLSALGRWTPVAAHWLKLHRHNAGRSIIMVTTVLSIFAIHTIEVWIWAAAFDAVGAVKGFENALTISTIMFSTVGYGDVVIAPAWRLFASLEAINGFILIGWSTAYLVGASTRHGPFRQGEHF